MDCLEAEKMQSKEVIQNTMIMLKGLVRTEGIRLNSTVGNNSAFSKYFLIL